jgi:hypothetical protein
MDKVKSHRMSHNLLTAARFVCYGLLSINTSAILVCIFAVVYFRKTGRLLGKFTAEQMEWRTILGGLFFLVLVFASLLWIASSVLTDDKDPRGEE